MRVITFMLTVAIIFQTTKATQSVKCGPGLWKNSQAKGKDNTGGHGTPSVYTETRNGCIRGRVQTLPSRGRVDEYLGIPFAKPPIGNLRLADPQPYGRFTEGKYDAADLRNSCPQFVPSSSEYPFLDMWKPVNPTNEDCLYMNIWVPKPRRRPMAVMVWLYGGGFYEGSNAIVMYDGKVLTAHNDVIMVVPNYRVGALGFLSTGNGRIKGNFGQKDQVLALQWVKDNIEFFGGDPDQVTIFGESAGAASVVYHLLSDQSNNLFQRAIIQSRSVLFMTSQEALERSAAFLQKVNCPNDNNVLDCLRNLTVNTFLFNQWVTTDFLVASWVPNDDDEIITDSPSNMIAQGKLQKKDILLMLNEDEGSYFVKLLAPPEYSVPLTYEQFVAGVDIVLHDLDDAAKAQIIELYKPEDENDLAGYRETLYRIAGDRVFKCPTSKFARLHAQLGNTYLCLLNYRASDAPSPEWMGVTHVDDIQWVFGRPFNVSLDYTSDEEDYSSDIMSYWTNFAKNGDPNSKDLPDWPAYTDSPAYLEFRGHNDYLIRHEAFRHQYCSVWETLG